METSDSKYLFNIGDPIDDNGFEVADEDVLTIWVKGRESPLSPHFYEAKLTADELRDNPRGGGEVAGFNAARGLQGETYRSRGHDQRKKTRPHPYRRSGS